MKKNARKLRKEMKKVAKITRHCNKNNNSESKRCQKFAAKKTEIEAGLTAMVKDAGRIGGKNFKRNKGRNGNNDKKKGDGKKRGDDNK
jgi:hypothetical protein